MQKNQTTKKLRDKRKLSKSWQFHRRSGQKMGSCHVELAKKKWPTEEGATIPKYYPSFKNMFWLSRPPLASSCREKFMHCLPFWRATHTDRGKARPHASHCINWYIIATRGGGGHPPLLLRNQYGGLRWWCSRDAGSICPQGCGGSLPLWVLLHKH